MRERIDPLPYDPERLFRHLRGLTGALRAPFAEAAVRRALETFEPEMAGCVVQLKACSRPGGGVYFRFFYNGPLDLTERARAAGMLPPEAAPLDWLQHDVLSALPGATRAGLDLDAGFGLAKTWTYTGGPVPTARVLALRAIPEPVRRHAALFERFGLGEVFFVATDHRHGTMNVYFGWRPEDRTAAWLQALARETGGAVPDEVACAAILPRLAASAGVGVTFAPGADAPLRWCVYGLEVEPDALALPGRLRAFADLAPTLNAEPQYNVAWSYGAAGPYLKLEKSYARDARHFLTVEMGGDLSHRAGEAPHPGRWRKPVVPA